MLALERQKRILEILNSEGSVLVSRLSSEMGVTEETVRRDLEKLEAKEFLRRTHGGALPISEGSYELSLEKRKVLNVEVKQALARKAAESIASGDTIFLDAATTTFYMAKEIKSMNNVTVITNSIRVINELAGVDGIKLVAVGGMVSNNQSFVGAMTENFITDNYFADKMFFSSKGIGDNSIILEGNEQECFIKQRMLKNARNAYYLCDKSKIDRVGYMRLASFEDIDYLVTDADVNGHLKFALEEANVKVIKA
ncbi:MAG: DeoR/GlpR family DNA-binding transcription regulator [Clostridia bacterium]|nr:DeoR/GlpR family DNA-binding transcription regulator [Clostridia bacterium]